MAVRRLDPSNTLYPDVALYPSGDVYAVVPSGTLYPSTTLYPSGALGTWPDGIPTSEAVGTPSVAFVSRPAPAGIATAEAFGTAVVTGNAPVQPTAIPSGEASGAPAVSFVSRPAPTGIPSGEAGGTPTLAFISRPAPSGITTGEAFGTSALTETVRPAPTGIATSEAFGAAVIKENVQLAPTGISTGETFGAAAVAFVSRPAPTGIPGAEAFGTAALTQIHCPLPVDGVPSGEAFPGLYPDPALYPSDTLYPNPNGPDIRQAVVVAPTGAASGEAVGAPALTEAVGIGPSGIPGAEAFGVAALTETVRPAPTGITTSEAFGSASITFVSRPVPLGIASGESVGVPSLVERTTITPTGTAGGEAFGTATLTQIHCPLLVDGVPSGEAFSGLYPSDTLFPGAGVYPNPYGPGLHQTVIVGPTGFNDGEGFGLPQLVQTSTVIPDGVVSAEFVSPARIAPAFIVRPTGIRGADTENDLYPDAALYPGPALYPSSTATTLPAPLVVYIPFIPVDGIVSREKVSEFVEMLFWTDWVKLGPFGPPRHGATPGHGKVPGHRNLFPPVPGEYQLRVRGNGRIGFIARGIHHRATATLRGAGFLRFVVVRPTDRAGKMVEVVSLAANTVEYQTAPNVEAVYESVNREVVEVAEGEDD